MKKIKLKPLRKFKPVRENLKRELEKQIIKIHGGQNEQLVSLINSKKKRREENKYLKS